MNIYFIAQSSGEHSNSSSYLAGSKKINRLLNILQLSGYTVNLINTDIIVGDYDGVRKDVLKLSSGQSVRRLSLITRRSRKVGMMLNIVGFKGVFRNAEDYFGKPDLVWCYNAYALEMLFLRRAKKKFSSLTVLEFEDWHFSRNNVFNIKSLLDYMQWKSAFRSIDYCFAVNEFLMSKMTGKCKGISLLPGIVSEDFINLSSKYPDAFAKDDQCINVGYFGGLAKDKGGEFVLSLAKVAAQRQLSIKFHITGHGVLQDQFYKLSKQIPKYFAYYGAVEESILYDKMLSMDVLLNPHSEVVGVFPFKLIEYAATGIKIISSPIVLSDRALVYVFSQIDMLDLDVDQWLISIANEQDLDARARALEIKEFVLENYSCQSIQNMIRNVIDDIACN